MAETINGVPIGDLPGIESVPDDSMLVVEFLGKAYHMPGAVLRQMIQDVLDSMGDSVDDVTEARLTAAIETVLASGKYNGVSPSVEVLDEEDGTSVIHVIDAFGDKRYPVEVKGATDAVRYKPQTLTDAQKAQARANIGALSAADISDKDNEVVIVKISGSFDAGYTVLWGGLPAPAKGLDVLVENGSIVIGVADGDLTFNFLDDTDYNDPYTVPAGTVFSYRNSTFWVSHIVDQIGEIINMTFALESLGDTWYGNVYPEQYTIYLTGDQPGRIVEFFGRKLEPREAYEILLDAANNDIPLLCYQKDAVFKLEDGSTHTPQYGTPFYYDHNTELLHCEHDGYVCTLYVDLDVYKATAEKNTPYKTAESKADDLKAEDGTLFLLSAGEPIGEGVPLPAGSADDSKIFIADLNTSTYEDIKAANDAGKICYALWGGYTACMLTTLSGDSAIFTTLLDPHLGVYVKFTAGTTGVSDFGLTESHSILYDTQSLTDAQKAQARENIGALSADDIDVDSIGSNVFVGKYDTVTFAEIKTAHDAGRVCFLNLDGLMLPLLNLSDTEAVFVREVNDTTDFKVTVTSADGKDLTLVDKNTPIYVAQTLTDDQKTQARTNIGALSTGDVDAVLQQAKDSGQFDGEDGYTPVKGKDYFDGYTPVKGKDYFDGANGKTAYAYAQDGGYTGTEAEFAKKLASESDSVFVADYDTTTFAEVKAAHNAGKVCFVKSDGMPFCQLLGIDDSEAIFIREINDTTDYKVTFTSAGGKDFTLVDKNTPIYVAQTLSDAQKTQARTNIGAAAAADIATTKYASTSTSSQSIFKISDFGSWGTGAWYQKGFSMLITSRAGETVWFSLSANDSATTARAFRLMNTYSKIAGVYYSVSENAVYVKANAWCNNVTAHILSNIGGDYVPTVASVSGLASDAVEVDIIEFGPTSSGLAVGDSSTPLLLGGSATRPTYNGADMALSSDLSGYLPTTGIAARATADANGNNIANTYANKNVGNTFDGEQKMVNSSYAPTMNDIAGGVGCSLKNARACDNQLIVAEIFAPTTAATDSTINMNAVVGEIGFYHGGSGNGGQFSDKMQLARITSAGIYEGSTLLSDKYLAKSGTAAKATADGNGNNIVSTYFPKSGGKFSGPISFDSASLPSKNLEYICGIDAFANGGQMGWQSKADFLSGCLSTNYVSTGITGGYGSIRLNTNNGSYYGLETAEGDRWMFNGTYCGFYNKYNQWPLILENCSTVDATLHVSKIGTGWGQDKHVEFVNGITAPALNVTGGAYISGRYFGGGDDEGLVIGRANNNYAGLTLGSHTGVRSTFYLMPDNSAVWRYNNGSTSYDIRHPGKAGTIALTDDVIEAANGALKVTLSGTSVDKTLAQIETALNAGRHVYMAENDGQVYQLSMHIAGMIACFTSVVAGSNTQVTVKTVVVYDGIEPSVFTKTL